MRIDILSPVSVNTWNKGIEDYANQVKSDGVEIVVSNLEKGVPSIECDYDVALAAPYIVEKAIEVEKAGADAFIDYCFAQPALEACKEKLSIPVVGIRESALGLAACLGNRIGVLAPNDHCVPQFDRGTWLKLHKVMSFNMPILDLVDDEKVKVGVDKRVGEMKSLGCDVIVLGCGSILGLDLAGLQKKHDIPVIAPLAPALYVAECLARTKLYQSKIAFPYPPSKNV